MVIFVKYLLKNLMLLKHLKSVNKIIGKYFNVFFLKNMFIQVFIQVGDGVQMIGMGGKKMSFSLSCQMGQEHCMPKGSPHCHTKCVIIL